MNAFSLRLLPLAALLLGAACGGREPAGPDVRVAQVDITSTGASLEVQQTLQLIAVVTNAAGEVLEQSSVAWSSGDPSRATVSTAGLVTGVEEGFVWVKAASEGHADSVLLDITAVPVPPPPPPPPPVPAPRLRLDIDAIELPIGDTVTVRATVYDAAGQPVRGVPINWMGLNSETVIYPFGSLSERRDSMRIRSRGAGVTTRVVARTDDGLADTVVVRGRPISQAITALDAGSGVTCGLDADGWPYCWGHFYPNDVMGAPLAVRGGAEPFQQIATGDSHGCGLTALGVAYCWGENTEGALGNGGWRDIATPTPVSGGHTFTSLDLFWHGCGLTPVGAAWCWGTNIYAQLGDGSQTNASVPVAVDGGHRFRSIAVGPHHTCGLTEDGQALCWGFNSEGQAGDDRDVCEDQVYGSKIACNRTPARLTTDLRFVDLAVGGRHTCGITAEGKAYCWGEGMWGQLGQGNTQSSRTPLPVLGSQVFRSIDAGYGHTCGITAAGKIWCWGLNDHGNNGVDRLNGQLCIVYNTAYNCNQIPVAVSGGLTFASLSVGSYHTCAMTSAHEPYCWGLNDSGQVGVGSFASFRHSAPQRVLDGR